jgi:N4-gp56 family major capsid protein
MLTNFGLLTSNQKTIWAMDLWKQARNLSFVNKFLGSDANAIVHHITELKKDEKGTRAVITLISDLTGDGVAGDRRLEGNEEGMQTFEQVIRIDQIRNANRLEGRMADQKSIVNFRQNSRNLLAYWLSDRIDQMAFLTMGGVSYTKKPNGATRVGSDLQYLEFAADVTAPSANRRLRWDGTNKLLVASGASSAVTAADTPSWELFVQLKAYAKDRYIRGTRVDGGDEVYHAFLCPQAMAKLKLDPTYMLNLRHSMQTDVNKKLFSGGGGVMIDGIVFHEFRHVPNTLGAGSGSKYGSGGTQEGSQIIFAGAQALGMADIGNPEWVEKTFDFDNQPAISVGKILGFLKPQFASIYENLSTEDFGVINVYSAM